MKRLIDNLVIDLTAGALMIAMAATGYILRFPLPPGSNKSLSLWGLTRHQWGDVHFWISLALLGILFIHVVLHWQWIVVSMRRKLRAAKVAPGPAWVSGLMTFVVIGAMLVLFARAAHQGVAMVSAAREDTCSIPPTVEALHEGKEKVDPATSVVVDAHRPSVFWKDVYPIFERSCISCHGPTKQKGSFRADRPDDYFAKRDGGPLIIPGKSDESPLIAIVSGNTEILRPDVHRLNPIQVDILRAWIDTGAHWPERPSAPE
jgi:hypothetical protein